MMQHENPNHAPTQAIDLDPTRANHPDIRDKGTLNGEAGYRAELERQQALPTDIQAAGFRSWMDVYEHCISPFAGTNTHASFTEAVQAACAEWHPYSLPRVPTFLKVPRNLKFKDDGHSGTCRQLDELVSLPGQRAIPHGTVGFNPDRVQFLPDEADVLWPTDNTSLFPVEQDPYDFFEGLQNKWIPTPLMTVMLSYFVRGSHTHWGHDRSLSWSQHFNNVMLAERVFCPAEQLAQNERCQIRVGDGSIFNLISAIGMVGPTEDVWDIDGEFMYDINPEDAHTRRRAVALTQSAHFVRSWLAQLNDVNHDRAILDMLEIWRDKHRADKLAVK